MKTTYVFFSFCTNSVSSFLNLIYFGFSFKVFIVSVNLLEKSKEFFLCKLSVTLVSYL